MGERRDGFDGFVAGAAPRLLRLAYLLTGSHQDAEDLLQEVLERLYVAWPRVREPFSYTRSALARQATNRRRTRGRHPETLMDMQMLASAPGARTMVVSSDATVVVDDQRVLMAALLGLPPHQRAVILLRYLEDLTEVQTAETLGCSVGAVKSQCSRALSRLRAVIDERPEPSGGAF